MFSGVARDVLPAEQLADVGPTPRPINPLMYLLAANEPAKVCRVLMREDESP